MTKDEALTMCLEYIETDKHERKYVRHAIKAALEQAEPPPEWEAINNIIAEYGLQAIDFVADWKAALEQPEQEPVASPYNPNPVEYQYHYPDGSWRCSNGDAINGMRPDRARSLYALKDNT